MTVSQIKAAVLFLGLATVSSNAYALSDGGWSSSGGDNKSMANGSAWFLGSDPIRYCMQIAPGFGKTQAELQSIFSAGVKTWETYVRSKDIHRDNKENLVLNFNFVPMSACDGSEDLRLFFGIENEDVIRERANYEKPTAFATRQSYNMRQGRGRGFIWFAQNRSVYPNAYNGFPNWDLPFTLHGMMLHELGHVFGCPDHVDGTIMSDHMMSKLQMMEDAVYRKRAEVMLTRIDDWAELYHCSTCPVDRRGAITYVESNPEAARTFQRFMGRAPVGRLRAHLWRPGLVAGPLTLTLNDDVGNRQFEVNPIANTQQSFTGAAKLFSVARIVKEDQFGNTEAMGWSYGTAGTSYLATIEAADGKSYVVTVGENVDTLGRPYRIQYLLDGKSYDLFNTVLDGME